MNAGGFDNLRPEAHADEAIRHIHALNRLAKLNLEELYEPIRDLGAPSPLRVFFFLYVSQTPASAEQISHFTKIPLRSVKRGLRKCRDAGFVEADSAKLGLWRVSAKYGTKA